MKKAAGVSDVDEVVRRFETQEETARHLQELQVRDRLHYGTVRDERNHACDIKGQQFHQLNQGTSKQNQEGDY